MKGSAGGEGSLGAVGIGMGVVGGGTSASREQLGMVGVGVKGVGIGGSGAVIFSALLLTGLAV